jgi:aryl-alcohol dehydrogenase
MGATIQKCGVIILVEPQAARRALALDYGATHVIDPAKTADLAAAVRAIAPAGVDYAFDTTGLPDILNAAMRALAPKGVLGVVGVGPLGAPPPSDMTTMVTFGLTIKGIIEGDSDPEVFLPELIDLHRRGELPFDRMITTYPFSQINEAIAAQHRGDCIKIVLLMDEEPELSK